MLNNTHIAQTVSQNLPKIIEAIKHAEQTAVAGTTGSDKLDLAATFMAMCVDIPVLPESAEQLLFKVAISTVIELARSIWGKDEWFTRLTQTLGTK